MGRIEPRNLRRRFVTPEGVDLQLELGGAASRGAALLLDLVAMLAMLIGATIALAFMAVGQARFGATGILWLLGAFVLRNGWFILFELGGRGATPGKRAIGLRVIARDGAQLSGSAVVARNAMREVELFLPLSFLAAQAAQGAADAFLMLFALGWTAIFLLFPLFNRDRLRMGDIIAGTWVVRDVRERLGADVGRSAAGQRFSEAALAIYGEYELQTLEEVLRAGKPESIATVAHAIRSKASLPDEGDDERFLADYYRELGARLERRLVFGHRRPDKQHRSGA